MIEIFLGISLIVCSILLHQILVLQSRIKELKEKSESEPPGYSKFLEDSREAAFSYIEQVQLSVLDFKNKTEAKNKTEIKESYNRLISLLPEEK
jgi:hypothetical protein